MQRVVVISYRPFGKNPSVPFSGVKIEKNIRDKVINKMLYDGFLTLEDGTDSLEAESTPGPSCGRKDYVNEKFQWHRRESNLRPFGV
jgi:hypothetical protein